MAKVLPLSMLKGACPEQAAIVRRLYPDGVPITLKAARKLRAEGVDIWWAQHFLSPAARAEYEEAIAPAWAEYQKAIAPARAAYEEAIDAALAEYEEVTAAAWAEYEKEKAAALLAALRAKVKGQGGGL